MGKRNPSRGCGRLLPTALLLNRLFVFPPRAQTTLSCPPPPPPDLGWGCQRLFLLLSHTSPTIVSTPRPLTQQGPQGRREPLRTSPPLHPCGCEPARVKPPEPPPPPRDQEHPQDPPSAGAGVTKPPLFCPKTMQAGFPKPPLPLSLYSSPEPAPKGARHPPPPHRVGGQALTPGSVQGCHAGTGQPANPQLQPGPGCPWTACPHAEHPGGLPASAPQLSPHLQQRG